jgi:hypothetical protein
MRDALKREGLLLHVLKLVEYSALVSIGSGTPEGFNIGGISLFLFPPPTISLFCTMKISKGFNRLMPSAKLQT